jgi:hypothetical protein
MWSWRFMPSATRVPLRLTSQRAERGFFQHPAKDPQLVGLALSRVVLATSIGGISTPLGAPLA